MRDTLFRVMHKLFRILLTGLVLCPAVRSQNPPSREPELPAQSRAVFETAVPVYNFDDANLKPWHLQASI